MWFHRVILHSAYLCFVLCAVYRTMNTFRFTGQAVTGVPQRPFLVPPQLTLTPSPPCLVTSHPPLTWRPPIHSSVAIMQPPPNHMIGPLPVIPGPPPPAPTPPQLFPPPPVTVTTQADCQPSTLLQPNYTFSVSDSKSKSSVETRSESKIRESSLRVRYPLGSKLKSSDRDVRLSKRTDMAIKLFTNSHDETDSKPSQQTSFVADFRFSMPQPPSSVKSVTSAATSLMVSSVDSGACAASPAVSLRSLSGDNLSPSVVSTPFSSLCISTPSFVPASGHWKSGGNPPPVTQIMKGLVSGSEVDEPLPSSHASLFSISTASPSSASSSSRIVMADKGGKSPQSVGRGKQLLDMLKNTKTSPQPTVGGLLVCLHACTFTSIFRVNFTKEVVLYQTFISLFCLLHLYFKKTDHIFKWILPEMFHCIFGQRTHC